jgi:hypothetical protein
MSDDPAERAAAVRIAASVAAHDGGAAQAAELFRWLGPSSDAVVSAAGAVITIGVGDAAAARAAISSESAGPPTSTARAARSLVEGLIQTLDSPYPVAIARLAQSITSDQPASVVTPDTPAGLVTLAALHGGDPVRAAPSSAAPSAPQATTRVSPPSAPTAARLGPDAGGGNWPRRGPTRRRSRVPTCTAAMPCGSLPCRPGSPGAVATAGGGAEALVRRDGGDDRVLSWTCTRYCRSASCGSPPVAYDRSTNSGTPSMKPSISGRPRQIGCCGRCRCTGRAYMRASWPIHRRPWRRMARR